MLVIGFEVAPRELCWGIRPRHSRRQLGNTADEIGEAGLVRKGGRQGHLDAGDHLGDAPGDFDQTEPDRVELSVAPERGAGRQATQVQHQPVGGRMDQEAELVGRCLAARGAVGGEVQLVRLDQVLKPPLLERLKRHSRWRRGRGLAAPRCWR